MERFSRPRFEQARAGRDALCEDLAQVLAERLAEAGTFHQKVYALVNELKAVGHDLTSFDESDDMQAWGPDYERASGPGLVITFTAPNEVDVTWSKQ